MIDPSAPAAAGLSRRHLLRGSLWLGAAAALPVGAVARANPGPDLERLPSAETLVADVRDMVALGARYPGSDAHRRWVDRMEAEFRAAGLEVARDRHHFPRWECRTTALRIDGATAPVAAAYPNSGITSPAGVSGPAVYLGPLTLPGIAELLDGAGIATAVDAAVQTLLSAVPGGVAGKIVVVDQPIAPLRLGVFDPILSYRHDPDGTLSADTDYRRAWTTLLTATTLTAFRAAGALAAVLVLDAAPENARGQFTPFTHPYQDLPALVVDRDTGARLRAAAERGAPVTVELQAQRTTESSDSLVAVLPGSGRTAEAVVLHTHSDGMNAFEENATVAQLHLARHFAARGRDNRERDLVISAVTGHFGPGLPETEGFLTDHPDFVGRAVASVTIEHFGATEWLDDADGYHATGQVEPTVAFHTPSGILDVAVDATRACDLRRFELLRPIGSTFFGVGAALHRAGIPGVAYIGGPNYLLSDVPDGHLDKLDGRRMAAEVRWTAELLHRLDRAPAQQLRH
ncbi:hypothetical protein ACFYT3_00570 [Nocardia amikacinitolerans]|uniref:hypothetical protein n=1 Tax=Nocardia amikacinitolerans TaxID=756689 RepID=UPI00367C938A